MDLLGLRTLTVIDDTVKMIEKNQGIKLDIHHIDLEDPKTCQMLCAVIRRPSFRWNQTG